MLKIKDRINYVERKEMERKERKEAILRRGISQKVCKSRSIDLHTQLTNGAPPPRLQVVTQPNKTQNCRMIVDKIEINRDN